MVLSVFIGPMGLMRWARDNIKKNEKRKKRVDSRTMKVIQNSLISQSIKYSLELCVL